MVHDAQESFQTLVREIAGHVAGRSLDDELEHYLNDTLPVEGETFTALARLCREGVREGWLCAREAGGIRYGRAVKPAADMHGLSVDVVLMSDVKGPHHRHPGGEIDAIIPETPDATFDGRGAGWLVYPPGSAHHPTVGNGRAIIVYFLPDGAIEFTGN